MTAKKKKRNEPKPLKSIVSNSRIFGQRLAGASHKIGALEFKYRALPAYVHTYVLAECLPTPKPTPEQYQRFFMEVARYGITAILEDGKPVEYGKKTASFAKIEFEGLDDESLYAIPGNMLSEIYIGIQKLMSLSDAEKTSVDFTTASEKAG